MNRVIKFRGQSIRSQKWIIGGIGDNNTDIIRGGIAIPVDPKTVGQFTGFKDIDGKEIFEGDLIQNDAHPNIVERVAMIGGCWSGIDVDDENDDLCWLLENAPYKVIGNIHDNAELLKGGD